MRRVLVVAITAYVVVMGLTIWAANHPGSRVRFAYSLGHDVVVPALFVSGILWLVQRRRRKA